jgi:tRNA (adenine57-N1/adenine58-N1)-methyltransferase catalytic subunit
MKLLIKNSEKMIFVKDPTKDIHTQYGYIKAEDMKKSGVVLKTNKDVEMTLIDAEFLDKLSKIKRGAQIIPLKDIGTIMMETGIGKESIVVDAGAGSGSMALCLANIAKKVYTYEIRQDHFDIVKANIEFMGMKNIELKLKSIYDGIDEKDVDMINLDVPEPWEAIKSAVIALKVGGYISSYSPTIPQVMDFVEALKNQKEFIYIKTIEIIEREWDVNQRKVRPRTQAIGHSGFITFARKIQ